MSAPDLLASCPITPLGVSPARDRCYYRLQDGSIVSLAPEKHGKLKILALFGADSEWLDVQFPQWSKPQHFSTDAGLEHHPGRIIGFVQHDAASWLISQCAGHGIYRDPDANSLAHCQDVSVRIPEGVANAATSDNEQTAQRCTEIADIVEPRYRSGNGSYGCTGQTAQRWQCAWEAACIALGGDPAEFVN